MAEHVRQPGTSRHAAEARPATLDRAAARERERGLLERAGRGDRDAFEALAIEAMPRLLGTATRLLGPGFAAEEAVADALFRAYRHIDRFRGGSAFSTWLHRIVCRVAADRFRELGRDRRLRDRLIERRSGGGVVAATEVPSPDPLERLAARERAAEIREVAMTLPPTQRLVLLLFAWEGLSLKDIAALLTLKYATVKSHLHHARSTLRKRCEPPGGEA